MILLAIDKRGVARLTLENPNKLNVLNGILMDDFARQVDKLSRDETLRALIVTGSGKKAFIGGADIGDMAHLNPDSARAFITRLHRCCDGLRRLPFPVIAQISGYALGAGLEIAAACDLRVASTTAKFGMPEVKVGIPSVIEAALLPALMGWGRARRMLFTGEIYSAREVEKWGLIDTLVPPDKLDKAVESLVKSILETAPNALRLQKELMRKWEDLPLSQAIAAGIESFAESFETDEPRTRMTAFLNRNKR